MRRGSGCRGGRLSRTISKGGAPARSAEKGAVSTADETGNGPAGAGSRGALLRQLRENAGLGTDSQGPLPNLRGAQFHGADLSGLDLSRIDLTGADLTNADLSDAHGEGVGFGNADLTRTLFFNARLAKGTFTRACLRHADLRAADLETRASWRPICGAPISRVRS